VSTHGTWQHRPWPVIQAPFTPGQVAALNAYQGGAGHPFTCGNDNCRGRARGRGGRLALIAGADGWHCAACDYTQDWAHAFMAAPALEGAGEGLRNEVQRFLTPEGRQAVDELFAKPDEEPVRQHQPWCGDASLSRPADECTCAFTPQEQRAASEVLYYPPLPRRGDAVEAWLLRWRDEMDPGSEAMSILDGMLDDYRLHADTGTPLNEEVHER